MIGAVALIGLLLFSSIVWLFVQECFENSSIVDERNNALHEEINDTLANLQSVYTSDTILEEVERLDAYTKSMDQAYTATIECSTKFKNIYYTITMLLFGAINGVSLKLYRMKKITLAQFSSVFFVSLYLVNHLKNIGGEIRDFVFNIGTLRKAQTYIDSLPVNNSSLSKENFVLNDNSIQMKNIRDAHDALNNVNVSISANEKVALMGKIGSGKSTLVKCLLNITPFQGNISIGGKDIKTMNPSKLRSQISYITQHPRLFNRSIYENIRYGCPGVTNSNVDSLISSIGRVLPNVDLHSNAGKNGERLSGGQRQIVFLLRCLLKKSKIVILDEPTASLDDKTKRIVIELIQKLLHDKTVIMITHDSSLLKAADQVISLDDTSCNENEAIALGSR
jgi:ABC-type multidrug transport system fused ATPase/permease subunit